MCKYHNIFFNASLKFYLKILPGNQNSYIRKFPDSSTPDIGDCRPKDNDRFESTISVHSHYNIKIAIEMPFCYF